MDKKILVALAIGMAFANPSSANDDGTLSVQLLQSLYSQAIKMDQYRLGFNNNELFNQFSTPSLKKILDADDKYMDKTGELGCLDYNILWQANEPVESAKLSFQQLDDKFIAVGIGATEGLKARSIIYEMSCNAIGCKIDDLWYEGESFKKGMTVCLKDLEAL